MKESKCRIVKNERIAENIYEMTLYDDVLEEIQCGQFANVQVPQADLLLKRPFGITKLDKAKRTFTVCYQIVGNGTQVLSKCKPGEVLCVTYPLGNGFYLNDSQKKVLLVGGGVGVFPLLSIPATYPDRKYYTFLGYRNAESNVYVPEFKAFSKETVIYSDDGSIGLKGLVTSHIKEAVAKIRPDVILACGPMPMFRSLKATLSDYPDIPCMVSTEERMGCGIGACLVCVCKIKRNGEVGHKRVCADGPVFELSEVVYDEQ